MPNDLWTDPATPFPYRGMQPTKDVIARYQRDGIYVAPDRMKALLENAGLTCVDFEGIAWSPTRGLHLSEDLRLNYLVAATHAR